MGPRHDANGPRHGPRHDANGPRHALATLTLMGSLVSLSMLTSASAQTREEKVRGDREKVEADGFWIYNDLDEAFRQGRESGKPILVVLRCIPCEECVKLDDDLVDHHPKIRPLLEQFVRARQVSTNGLDLDLFQFDTDQSFAAFLLNADGTIYGRFGTRSHRTEWYADVSLEGLAEALQGALELHADYPANRNSLVGKRGKPLEVASPERYPRLRDQYTDALDYEGNVVKSCIHCHQIGDARRSLYRDRGEPIPAKLLFPYPHPKSIGLVLDPDTRATVKSVAPDSLIADSGWKTGDRIERLNGQPMLSMADVQWVLHQVPADGGELVAEIDRDGDSVRSRVTLPEGWRNRGDISWRVSSWGLRRMVTGGLRLEAADDAKRRQLEIPDGEMALTVTHVGQYGPHAAAKRAGFEVDDVIVEYEGRRDLMTDSELLAHGAIHTRPGRPIDVTVIRDGNERDLQLPGQK